MNAAGDAGSGNAGINDYFWRVGENVKTVLERDMVGFILPSVIRGSEESGTELLGLGGGMKIVFGKVAFAEGAKWFSIFFSAIILIGIGLQCKNQISSVEIALGLTLILAIIWPWYTFRFILPFLPFLISYFVISLRAIPRFLEKYINIDINEYIVVRVLLICLLCFFIIEHSSYINAKQRTPQAIGWIADFDTVSNLIENINTQLPAQSLIASTNPAQIFLLTGHQGISVGLDDTTWEYWRRAGLRYVVNTKPTMPITGKKGDKNDVIYQASDLPNIQIVDLGETQHLAKLDLLNPN